MTTANPTTMPIMLPDPSPYAYRLRGLGCSFDDVMRATADERSCIDFCQAKGLLARRMLCAECDGDMRLCPPSANASEDKAKRWRWRCSRKGCRKERSLRAGSFFAKMKLTLCQCVRLMYFWASSLPAGVAMAWVGVSDKAVTDWYSFCRDICSKEMLACPMQVGGPDHIVEIDETSLKKKSKFNRGHKLKKMRGIDKHLLPSYLDEYLWRSWYFDGTVSPSAYFEGLLAGINKHYCH
eukprot:jgi/Phyca11/21129/fgenesh1_pg.PHYCAscaffold_83_\